MAGTPSKHTPRVIHDFDQPQKFLRDARAKISSRASKSRSTRRP